MTRYFHSHDERFSLSTFVFFTLLFLFAKCQCNGQTHFQFNTSTVVMLDTTGEMQAGSAVWKITAIADTLRIEPPYLPPMVWWGIKWRKMDSGALYYFTAGFMASYKPGPNGQALIVKPTGRFKVMEFYERETGKL